MRRVTLFVTEWPQVDIELWLEEYVPHAYMGSIVRERTRWDDFVAVDGVEVTVSLFDDELEEFRRVFM